MDTILFVTCVETYGNIVAVKMNDGSVIKKNINKEKIWRNVRIGMKVIFGNLVVPRKEIKRIPQKKTIISRKKEDEIVTFIFQEGENISFFKKDLKKEPQWANVPVGETI